MARGRQFSDDALHIPDKPHIKHPVRLIEHQGFHPVQLNMPLPNQIVQPSGCCDKDIHPALQRIYLRVLGYAAKNHLCSQPQIASVCPEIFRNL